jgi:hypothetical protein
MKRPSIAGRLREGSKRVPLLSRPAIEGFFIPAKEGKGALQLVDTLGVAT